MRFTQHYAGKNGWSEWIRPRRRGYKMACCDCGLVHDLDFRIRKEWRGNVVEFKARRNKRSTASMRRHMK